MQVYSGIKNLRCKSEDVVCKGMIIGCGSTRKRIDDEATQCIIDTSQETDDACKLRLGYSINQHILVLFTLPDNQTCTKGGHQQILVLLLYHTFTK